MSLEYDICEILKIIERGEHPIYQWDLIRNSKMLTVPWLAKLRRELPNLLAPVGSYGPSRAHFTMDQVKLIASIRVLRMNDVSFNEMRNMSKKEIMSEASKAVNELLGFLSWADSYIKSQGESK